MPTLGTLIILYFLIDLLQSHYFEYDHLGRDIKMCMLDTI